MFTKLFLAHSQCLQWNAFHIKNSPIIIILLTVANSANFGNGHVRTPAFNKSLHVRHFQHLKLRETTIRKVIAQNVQHTREIITTSTRRNRQPIVWLPNYFNNLVEEGRQATLLHDLTRRRCWTKLKIIFQSLILYFCCRFCGCLQVTSAEPILTNDTLKDRRGSCASS